MMKRLLTSPLLSVLWCAALAACTLVDEDERECAPDCQLSYTLRLEATVQAQLEAVPSLSDAPRTIASLERYLQPIFSGQAHDVDLSFYDAASPEGERLHHESHIMDAAQSSYTLRMPARDYLHLAVANLSGNGVVSLQDAGRSGTAVLTTRAAGDTLENQQTALFVARVPMKVQPAREQAFQIPMHLCTCAAVLVLDTLGSGVRDLKVYLAGSARSFSLSDSTYHFGGSGLIAASRVPAAESLPGDPVSYAAVSFPSRMPVKPDGPLWQFKTYATLADGSITETVLSLEEPLLPGSIKTLRATVEGSGALETVDANVGVSVCLDWTPGINISIDL